MARRAFPNTTTSTSNRDPTRSTRRPASFRKARSSSRNCSASSGPSGSRTEPSGRGYFPGELNGADGTVKDTKRYAPTGSSWGYYNFNHHEPKAATAKVRPKSECAFCHIASAKKDEVWTQFYQLLD